MILYVKGVFLSAQAVFCYYLDQYKYLSHYHCLLEKKKKKLHTFHIVLRNLVDLGIWTELRISKKLIGSRGKPYIWPHIYLYGL